MSKSKSFNFPPIVDTPRSALFSVTIPSKPLTVPTGAGISLTLNLVEVAIFFPSGKVALALMLTSLPFPGTITYFDPLTFLSPGADAETLLFAIPGIDIVIGLSTPLYTTFILSADITAELGFAITGKDWLTGIFDSIPSFKNTRSPTIS